MLPLREVEFAVPNVITGDEVRRQQLVLFWTGGEKDFHRCGRENGDSHSLIVGPLLMMKEQGFRMPIEYLMWAPLVGTSLVLYATLAAGALFSIANSDWVSPSSRRLWAAAVILLPIVGAVLWLAASHHHNTTHDDVADADRPPKADAGTVAPATRFLAKGKPAQRTQAKRTSAKRTPDKRALSRVKPPPKRTKASDDAGRRVPPVHRLRKDGGI